MYLINNLHTLLSYSTLITNLMIPVVTRRNIKFFYLIEPKFTWFDQFYPKNLKLSTRANFDLSRGQRIGDLPNHLNICNILATKSCPKTCIEQVKNNYRKELMQTNEKFNQTCVINNLLPIHINILLVSKQSWLVPDDGSVLAEMLKRRM